MSDLEHTRSYNKFTTTSENQSRHKVYIFEGDAYTTIESDNFRCQSYGDPGMVVITMPARAYDTWLHSEATTGGNLEEIPHLNVQICSASKKNHL